MMNNMTISAKVDLDKDTFKEIVSAQKDIEMAVINAISTNVQQLLNVALLAQQARIAEAEIAVTEAKARIAEAETQRVKHEAEKAKYAAQSSASDAEFRKSVKSAKKPYTNGVAAYNGE